MLAFLLRWTLIQAVPQGSPETGPAVVGAILVHSPASRKRCSGGEPVGIEGCEVKARRLAFQEPGDQPAGDD